MDVSDLIGYSAPGQQRGRRSSSRSGTGGIAIPGASMGPPASSFAALYNARGRSAERRSADSTSPSASLPPDESPVAGSVVSPAPPFSTPLASPLGHSLGLDVAMRPATQQAFPRVPPPSLSSSLASTTPSFMPQSPLSPSARLEEEPFEEDSVTPPMSLSASPRSRRNSVGIVRVAETGQLQRARGASSAGLHPA